MARCRFCGDPDQVLDATDACLRIEACRTTVRSRLWNFAEQWWRARGQLDRDDERSEMIRLGDALAGWIDPGDKE